MGGLSSMYMMRADVKVPLWYFRKQRPGVAESVYNLDQSRRVYESADQELHLRIQQDYLLANASARLIRLYGQTVVPQAALALESSLASYETGAVDFLSVIANFNSTHEFEMNYYEEIQNLYLAVSRLEQWTGEQLIQ